MNYNEFKAAKVQKKCIFLKSIWVYHRSIEHNAHKSIFVFES